MRSAVAIIALVLIAPLAHSGGSDSETSAAALVGSLFGSEPDLVPVEGLSGTERATVEEYNRCVQRFSSRIPVDGLPQGPRRWLVVKRQRVERGMVCVLGGDGVEDLAASYAREAELFYEWEGMSDGPLAEAEFAEAYLRSHHDTPLAPYLQLFIAHRSRGAAEALAAEGNDAGAQRATNSCRRHLEAVRGGEEALVRLAAAGIESMPYVYIEPLRSTGPPATAPPLSLRQALDRAESEVRDHDVDTTGQFLHSVSLRHDDDPASRGSYWLVQWAWVQPRLGGEVSVRVDMDGAVSVRRLGP